MRNPLPREELHIIVLVSLIVLLRGFHYFCMVHPIPTSPFIQLNALVPHIFDGPCINVATCMRTCIG